MYKALLIEKDGGPYRASIQSLDDDNLPEGDVTVKVDYSTINYKDGLAITGKAPVVRKFPLVAGIDFAGTVQASSHPCLEGGRQGGAQRLGRRRDAFRRAGAARARQGRLAGGAAAGLERARRPWPSARQATPPCCA